MNAEDSHLAGTPKTGERNFAEESFQKSERRLRAVLDTAAMAIINLDASGAVLDWNLHAEKMFGWTWVEMVGSLFTKKIIPTEHRTALEQVCRDSLKTGEGAALNRLMELSAQHRDGRRFPIEISICPLADIGTAAFCVFIADITERKLVEKQLRDQAAWLEKASDAILGCDLEGRVTFWNKGAQHIYGWSAVETMKKSLAELIFSNAPGRMQTILRETLEKGEWMGDLSQVTKPGKIATVQSRWTRVLDENEKPVSLLVINTDITEKKQLETQFLRAQRMESIGILAGGIAHDLNNVLAPILMVSQLLRMKENDAESLEWLNTLENSAKHGADLIKQVLAFARGVEGERIEMQVGHLIRDLCKILQETLPRSIELKVNLAKDLWTINGVATHLNQVLMNLCVNARDAMPQGGRLLIATENVSLDEVYARLHSEARMGNYVVISVTDTGLGIPPQVMEQIYDPFFTTKEVGKGTGLGLSTVKGIVKSHGGFIHVYSEQGRGTTFHIYLPALLSSALAAHIEQARAALPRGQGETILVVDDEEGVRDITRATLEKFGYRVLVACDGLEGKALFLKHRPIIHLVVTDMMMPRLDGSGLIRAIQNIAPETKIMALSGLMESECLEETDGTGTIPLIAKPFANDKFLLAVHALLHPTK